MIGERLALVGNHEYFLDLVECPQEWQPRLEAGVRPDLFVMEAITI